MTSQPISRSLSQTFKWSFLISIACLVGLVILAVTGAKDSTEMKNVAVLFGMVMIASGLVWYVSLGMVADQLGRSWIIWVGLTFITTPFGPPVAFLMMRSHMQTAAQVSTNDVPNG